MNLSPASGNSPALLPEPGAARRLPDVSPARQSVAPGPQIGSDVMVEFGKHPATGAQTVKFVDKKTGATVQQLPAEQVLDAVAQLMEMFRKREA